MPIKTELEKAAENLRSARNAIINRGGEISPTAGLKDLSEAITSIPNDASVAFHIDNVVAHKKTVPNNAGKYAYLNSIGGMSYEVTKRNPANLISLPYVDKGATSPHTFVCRPDGSVQAKGAPSDKANTTFYALAMQMTLSPGIYTLSGSPSGYGTNCSILLQLRDENNSVVKTFYDYGNGTTIDLTKYEYSWVSVRLHVSQIEITTDDCIFRPMLNVGTEALPYEVEDLHHAKPTALRSYKADGTLLAECALPTDITDKLGLGYDKNLFNEYSFTDGVATERLNSTVISGTAAYFGIVGGRDRVGYALPSDAVTLTAAQLVNIKAYLKAPIFGNDYTAKQMNDGLGEDYQVVGQAAGNLQYAFFFFPKGTFATKEEAEAWFDVRQLPIVYELQDYIRTSIETDFNPLIEVEPGGYIELVNEGGYAVPSAITYAIEVD